MRPAQNYRRDRSRHRDAPDHRNPLGNDQRQPPGDQGGNILQALWGNAAESDDPDFTHKVRIIHKIIKAVHHLKNISGSEVPLTITRTTQNLAALIKPASPNDETQLLLEGNAKNWEHTTILILQQHYEDSINKDVQDLAEFSSLDWEGPFEVASTWARRNLGNRLKPETIQVTEAFLSANLSNQQRIRPNDNPPTPADIPPPAVTQSAAIQRPTHPDPGPSTSALPETRSAVSRMVARPTPAPSTSALPQERCATTQTAAPPAPALPEKRCATTQTVTHPAPVPSSSAPPERRSVTSQTVIHPATVPATSTAAETRSATIQAQTNPSRTASTPSMPETRSAAVQTQARPCPIPTPKMEPTPSPRTTVVSTATTMEQDVRDDPPSSPPAEETDSDTPSPPPLSPLVSPSSHSLSSPPSPSLCLSRSPSPSPPASPPLSPSLSVPQRMILDPKPQRQNRRDLKPSEDSTVPLLPLRGDRNPKPHSSLLSGILLTGLSPIGVRRTARPGPPTPKPPQQEEENSLIREETSAPPPLSLSLSSQLPAAQSQRSSPDLSPDVSPPSTHRPTRHINTIRKLKDWSLSIKKKILIVGDSNVSRLPPFQNQDLQVDSYPGATFQHAEAILQKAEVTTEVETVILSFGLNCRNQKVRSTTIKQLQKALRAAKNKLPEATILVPVINFSSNLPQKEKRNLQVLNNFISHKCDAIPHLPSKDFETEMDKIHWTRRTASRMLDHWLGQVN